MLERRDVVGGAAITEKPWGPDFKMTALSYVVSLMPPTILRELELEKHGYRIHAQGPYFAPHPDGRALALSDDPRKRRESIAQFSSRDADAYERWEAWLGSMADVLSPLLTETPPRLGSHQPADLFEQAKLAWQARSWDVRDREHHPPLHVEHRGPARGRVRVRRDARRAVGQRRHRHLGRPAPHGTAYVMAHHKIGDVGDGKLGAWGFPEGGMGAVTQALRDAAESFGATVRTEVDVTRIVVRDGTARGVVLSTGEQIDADVVIAATHPQITFLQQLEPSELPDDFVDDLRRWKSRSGTVKVNLAIDRLPEFTAAPGFDPDVHGGTIVLAPSLDHVENAFQDAVAGRPAGLPFADICIPSVFDRTLAPEGQHVVSMFTQWVPHQWSTEPHYDELDAYADRVIDQVDAVAPGFRSSILHRQVIGPYDMEHTYGLIGGNIFHGELSPTQLFHMRPARATPTTARRSATSTRRRPRPTAAAASPGSPASRSSSRSATTARSLAPASPGSATR